MGPTFSLSCEPQPRPVRHTIRRQARPRWFVWVCYSLLVMGLTFASVGCRGRVPSAPRSVTQTTTTGDTAAHVGGSLAARLPHDSSSDDESWVTSHLLTERNGWMLLILITSLVTLYQVNLGWKSRRGPPSGDGRRRAVIAGITGGLGVGLFTSLWILSRYSLPGEGAFWLLSTFAILASLGFLAAECLEPLERPTHWKRASKVTLAAVILVTVLVGLALNWSSLRAELIGQAAANRGRELLREGRAAEAIPEFDRMVEYWPREWRSYSERARAHELNRDCDRAVQDRLAMAHVDKNSYSGRHEAIKTYLRFGRSSDARALAQEFASQARVSGDSDDWELWQMELAFLEIRLKNDREAVQLMTELLDSFQGRTRTLPLYSNATIVWMRAEARMRLGDYAEAITDFKNSTSEIEKRNHEENRLSLSASHSRLAWVYSTCPDASIRSSTEADRHIVESEKAIGVRPPKSTVAIRAIPSVNSPEILHDNTPQWETCRAILALTKAARFSRIGDFVQAKDCLRDAVAKKAFFPNDWWRDRLQAAEEAIEARKPYVERELAPVPRGR